MGQEFVIKSQILEDKINQLLPSQGFAGAGVDLSASTTVIPIVDLTESAEGSNLRQDLQTATDFATTVTTVQNASNVLLANTTGFFRVTLALSGTVSTAQINLFDGATSKIIRQFALGSEQTNFTDDFIVFLSAGLSLRGTSSASTNVMYVGVRQVADVSGNLTNPLGF